MSYTLHIYEPNRTLTLTYNDAVVAEHNFRTAFIHFPQATKAELLDEFSFQVYEHFNEKNIRYYIVKCAGVEKHFYHIEAALTHLKALNDFFAESEIVATLEAVN